MTNAMVLKPQDIVVVLKYVALGKRRASFSTIAHELAMSPSEVHAATKRAEKAGLLSNRADGMFPVLQNLEEFVVHGLPYVFVPERAGLARGILTGFSAPVLKAQSAGIVRPRVPYVWPSAEGNSRGEAISPLYKSVPHAVKEDDGLYALLALVDVLRIGRARERQLAVEILKDELRKEYGSECSAS